MRIHLFSGVVIVVLLSFSTWVPCNSTVVMPSAEVEKIIFYHNKTMFIRFYCSLFTLCLPVTSGAGVEGADGSALFCGTMASWISTSSSSSLSGLCVSSTSPAASFSKELGYSAAGLEGLSIGSRSPSMSMSVSKGSHQLSAHKRN